MTRKVLELVGRMIMKKFQVIADSTCDVEKVFRDEVELDYVKMVFNIKGVEYMADLDWQEITPQEYYELMRQGNRSLTGLAATGEIEEKFKKYLEQDLDILYISCSSKLSGTVNNARLVAQELKELYPERRIVCFDSLRSNYAQGIMALDAAKMALAGKELDEVISYLEANCLNYQVHGTVGTLHYLKLCGRVKASAAFFGNLLGVKPLIVSDINGNNFAHKKVKGRKTSLDELINIIKAEIINPSEATLYIEHADCLVDAQYMADKLNGFVNKINISYVGPIIGASIGPDAITCSFYGNKVVLAGEE